MVIFMYFPQREISLLCVKKFQNNCFNNKSFCLRAGKTIFVTLTKYEPEHSMFLNLLKSTTPKK